MRWPWDRREKLEPPTITGEREVDQKALFAAADKLAPCPWCGEVPELGDFAWGWGAWVHCVNDSCPIQPSSGDLGTFEDAVTAWNKRVGGERKEPA